MNCWIYIFSRTLESLGNDLTNELVKLRKTTCVTNVIGVVFRVVIWRFSSQLVLTVVYRPTMIPMGKGIKFDFREPLYGVSYRRSYTACKNILICSKGFSNSWAYDEPLLNAGPGSPVDSLVLLFSDLVPCFVLSGFIFRLGTARTYAKGT